MNTWHKQRYIVLLVICFVLGKQNSLLANRKISATPNFNTSYLMFNQTHESLVLAQKSVVCQDVDPDYQEVYSFETEEYSISICQLGANFYYHRQSKDDITNKLLIRAESVFSGEVFQAIDGKTVYFIGKDGDRYYSSVMENNSEIVFEPELETSISTDSIKKVSSTSTPPSNRVLEEVSVDSELDSPEELSSQSLVCTKENSTFHPHLNGWQKLIGKSPDIANQYAVNNGHNFRYRGNPPQEALIKTRGGATINLDIAVSGDAIDRVCVQPLTE